MKNFYSKLRMLLLIVMTIASIQTIHAQDSIYIMKNNALVAKYAVLDIDSIIFYAPPYYANGGGVTDIDGNNYPTIIIGDQEWMKENLNVTKLNDNTSIPVVTDNTAWSTLTTEGMSWYNNDQSTYTANKYGALYNFYAVNSGKLCPTGWHVPSKSEWNTLVTYLGGFSLAGGKIKEAGLITYIGINYGNNESNFTALGAGDRNNMGPFYDKGYNAYFWSSTAFNSSWSYYYGTYGVNKTMAELYGSKNFGFSVRCLKD